ncbi:MAG TPA: YdcH family protein [Thermoanaerobaculia bacterium]|nr:YdcH family protein [Thermoanaerobaculia bacterium]
MSNQIADIQRILSTEDDEFRKWLDEHHACESRLGELTTKNEVSIDEELEEKTLKKRKLQLKDQMAARIRSYETANAMA